MNRTLTTEAQARIQAVRQSARNQLVSELRRIPPEAAASADGEFISAAAECTKRYAGTWFRAEAQEWKPMFQEQRDRAGFEMFLESRLIPTIVAEIRPEAARQRARGGEPLPAVLRTFTTESAEVYERDTIGSPGDDDDDTGRWIPASRSVRVLFAPHGVLETCLSEAGHAAKRFPAEYDLIERNVSAYLRTLVFDAADGVEQAAVARGDAGRRRKCRLEALFELAGIHNAPQLARETKISRATAFRVFKGTHTPHPAIRVTILRAVQSRLGKSAYDELTKLLAP